MTRPCGPGFFRCGDGQCIHSRQRCNGRRDCRDSSDELGCGPRPPSKSWNRIAWVLSHRILTMNDLETGHSMLRGYIIIWVICSGTYIWSMVMTIICLIKRANTVRLEKEHSTTQARLYILCILYDRNIIIYDRIMYIIMYNKGLTILLRSCLYRWSYYLTQPPEL